MRDLSTAVLRSDTRSVDELARAKSEFMVILPSVARAGAEVCGKRLEEKMRRYLEHHRSDTDTQNILSLAIYEYPEDKVEVDALLGRFETD